MSTRYDILAAKQRYEDHVSEHKCRIGQCPIRAGEWLVYMKTARL